MAATSEFCSGTGLANGAGFLVNAVASPGDTIHTAHASAVDELWLWASNTHTSAITLTLQVGGTAAKDAIETAVPAGATVLVCPGLRLSNSFVTRAYASVADKVTLHGHVNRLA